MATQKMQLKMTSEGKTLTRTLSHTNQSVDNDILAQFGNRLAALTTNTYGSTDRITTVNCDTEEGGGVKPTPTLSMATTSYSAATLDSGQFTDDGFEITTNSDGKIALSFSGFDSATGMTMPTASVLNGRLYIHKAVFSNQTATGTIHVTALPSENFGISNTVNFTVTA